MSATLRIGALLSGGGRTALNLAAALERERIPATIAVAIAHREDVPGVARLRAAGVPVRVAAAGAETEAALAEAAVDLICLCGYLQYLTIPASWRGRVINIHPALLPDFGGKGMYGRRVHEAVLAAGARESGCTVHAVDDDYDRGPILLQRRCPVLPGDTAATLAERVFVEECRAYPEVVRHIAEGALRLPIPLGVAGANC